MMRRLRLIAEIAVTALCLVLAGGCVGPTGSADGAGVTVANSTHNFARQDGTTWETAIAGPFPTHTVIDDAGANVQTGGPNTVLGLVLSEEAPKLFTSNPADTTFDRLVYDRGGGTLTIEGFSSQKSSVIAAYDQQIIAWAQVQSIITQEQAAVAIKLIESGMTALEAITTVLGGI